MLTPEQLDRAWVLYLQEEGPRALEFPLFAKRLHLTEAQSKQIDEIILRFWEKHAENFRGMVFLYYLRT